MVPLVCYILFLVSVMLSVHLESIWVHGIIILTTLTCRNDSLVSVGVELDFTTIHTVHITW